VRFLVGSLRVVDRCCGVAGAIAAWLGLLLILLTVEEVLARYLFNAPSHAVEELKWHVFGSMFLLAGAYSLRRDAHVRVDLLYHRSSQRTRAIVDILGLLCCLGPLCWVLISSGIDLAIWAYRKPIGAETQQSGATAWLFEHVLRGERSPESEGLPARWIIKAMIPLGGALLAAQGLSLIAQELLFLLGRGPYPFAAAPQEDDGTSEREQTAGAEGAP